MIQSVSFGITFICACVLFGLGAYYLLTHLVVSVFLLSAEYRPSPSMSETRRITLKRWRKGDSPRAKYDINCVHIKRLT